MTDPYRTPENPEPSMEDKILERLRAVPVEEWEVAGYGKDAELSYRSEDWKAKITVTRAGLVAVAAEDSDGYSAAIQHELFRQFHEDALPVVRDFESTEKRRADEERKIEAREAILRTLSPREEEEESADREEGKKESRVRRWIMACSIFPALAALIAIAIKKWW